MISAITFCSESMARSACVCVASARVHGVDTTDIYTYERLKTTQFYRDNEALLSQPRGCGYWAWKPFVIAETMHELNDGDVVVYADAGIEFIGNVSEIISRMDQPHKIGRAEGVGGYGDVWVTSPQNDIFLFGNNYEHAHWCKRDAVDAVWPPSLVRITPEIDWCQYGKQVQASVIFFRVSDYTRKFVAEWLRWCLVDGGRLIDDSPSIAPNHPEFREHRHDQAILTTMAYREDIKLHWWPASYNNGAFTYEKLAVYAGDDYPVLFNHHRKRNDEWVAI